VSRRKPDPASDTPGGQGDPPTRSELNLITRAIHQDWPISLTRQKLLISWCFQQFDPKRAVPAKARVQAAAARAIAALSNLALKQQSLDLARDKIDGQHQLDFNFAQAVAEAEDRAEKRRKSRKK
jgi:hypothetical protein